jgi:hypothetical protein
MSSDANVDANVDWIEVSREGHELALRHGRMAYVFAASLADEAGSAGDFKAVRFWRAVAKSLAPRA